MPMMKTDINQNFVPSGLPARTKILMRQQRNRQTHQREFDLFSFSLLQPVTMRQESETDL
jgi:hypothetical protein